MSITPIAGSNTFSPTNNECGQEPKDYDNKYFVQMTHFFDGDKGL